MFELDTQYPALWQIGDMKLATTAWPAAGNRGRRSWCAAHMQVAGWEAGRAHEPAARAAHLQQSVSTLIQSADETPWIALQVVDWELGGRTSHQHAQRIFSKERRDGPQSVIAVLHRCAAWPTSVLSWSARECKMRCAAQQTDTRKEPHGSK